MAGAKYSIAPQGHFFGLETGTYGPLQGGRPERSGLLFLKLLHRSVRAGALDAQIGAQNPKLVGSQAPRPL